ncbi:MAG: hypothetical protein HY318_04140 [Armatimonadetes bacterium]|nr:hypothetical protein [Armatimonadota bacterium]
MQRLLESVLLLTVILSLAGLAHAGVVVKDRGTYENHRDFQFGKGRRIDLRTGTTEYSLLLQTFKEDLLLPPGKERCRIGLLTNETDRGWYGYGFVDLLLNGNPVHDCPAQVTSIKGGEKGIVDIEWDTREAKVVMEFSCQENADNLFLEVRLHPKRALRSVKAQLLCYPGDYAKEGERDRWISTAKRDVQAPHGKEFDVPLDKDEAWVFYYDRIWDPAKTGSEYHSSCALLYPPREPEEVVVNHGDYSIHTRLHYPASTKSIHLILWKFPGRANAQALEYMKKLRWEK